MDRTPNAEIAKLLYALGYDIYSDSGLVAGLYNALLIIKMDEGKGQYHQVMESPLYSKNYTEYYQIPKIKKREDVSQKQVNQWVDQLCALMISEGYAENPKCFFAQMTPWIVGQSYVFYHVFKNKNDLGTALAVLHRILKIIENYDGEVAEIDPHIVYQNTEVHDYFKKIIPLSEEKFTILWTGVTQISLTDRPIKINGNVQRAIESYRKNYIPNAKFYSDYLSMITSVRRARNPNYVAYPYNQRYADARKTNAERGMTSDEREFDSAIYAIKNEPPTEVIRALSYSQNRDDSALEAGLVLNDFYGQNPSAFRYLIVNPSPYMIEFWTQKLDAQGFAGESIFAVSDKTIAGLYADQYRNQREFQFISMEEIAHFSVDAALLVARDLPYQEQLKPVVSLVLQCAKQSQARVSMLLPNSFLDRETELKMKKTLLSAGVIHRILILPTQVSRSSPRKKILLHMQCVDQKIQQKSIPFFSSAANHNGDILYINHAHQMVLTETFLNEYTSINRMYHDAYVASESETFHLEDEIIHRKAARRYSFSEEIVLHYVLMKNRKNRDAAQAYYCKTLPPNMHTRRKKGVSITPKTERGLRKETVFEVIDALEYVPFYEDFCPIILQDLVEAYGDKQHLLSLKTLWFMYRSVLENDEEYDDQIATSMFCSRGGRELSDIHPAVETDCDYEPAVARLGWDAAKQESAWEQLNLLLNCLLTKGILTKNPVETILPKVSRKTAKRVREVRNALMKKTFSDSEEQRMIAYISEPSEADFGMNKAPLYVAQSGLLCGAIRFFTGMTLREVCALNWEDFVELDEVAGWQFYVTKVAKNDGTVEVLSEKKMETKFRRVPCCTYLKNMLLFRRSYLELTRQKKVPGNEPIILEHDDTADRCKPATAKKFCAKMIHAAGIDPMVLKFFDEDGDAMETDISKYSGDIFQSNFKFRAAHTSYMKQGEINYIVGVQAPDTYNKHYKDHINDFIQKKMIVELDRWGSRFAKDEKQGTAYQHMENCGELNHCAGPYKEQQSAIQMDLEGCEGQWNLDIHAEHGFTGEIFGYMEEH